MTVTSMGAAARRLPSVVVGVGDGLLRTRVLDRAVAEARRRDRTVRVVHADAPAGSEPPSYGDAGDRAESYLSRTAPDVEVRRTCATGDPASAMAAACGASSLLVVGDRHRRLGSEAGRTTEELIAIAPCPVLVLGEDRAPSAVPVPRRAMVVVGIDEGAGAAIVLDHALRIAEMSAEPVEVVHAVDEVTYDVGRIARRRDADVDDEETAARARSRGSSARGGTGSRTSRRALWSPTTDRPGCWWSVPSGRTWWSSRTGATTPRTSSASARRPGRCSWLRRARCSSSVHGPAPGPTVPAPGRASSDDRPARRRRPRWTRARRRRPGPRSARDPYGGAVVPRRPRAQDEEARRPRLLRLHDRGAPSGGLPREIALNRRLSPEAYLGLETVLGPSGEAEEYLVAMRRMPADRSLAALVRAGEPVEDHLRAVARRLAGFHSAAARGPAIAREGSREAARARWEGVLDGLRRHAGALLPRDVVDRVAREATAFLDGRADLFAARRAEDRVVDGHGDLLADDVFCLPEGPVLLDCLEFDDRLRYVDGLDDAAFLAMDLERLGGPEPAARFLALYAEFAADPAPPALSHHFVAYRAAVRAAVTCLRVDQGGGDAEEARDLLDLVDRHLQDARVRLVLVGGLPGTGKTTVAGGVADRWGRCWCPATGCVRSWPGATPPTPRPPGTATASIGPSTRTRRTRPCSTGPRNCSAGARRSCSTPRGPTPGAGTRLLRLPRGPRRTWSHCAARPPGTWRTRASALAPGRTPTPPRSSPR